MRINSAKLLTFFLILFICAWRYYGDYWHSKWAVTLAFGSILIGVAVKNSLRSYWAGLTTAWSLIMGLWVFAWRDNYYQVFEAPVRCTFDITSPAPKEWMQTVSNTLWSFMSTSAYATAAFLILGMVCLNLCKKIRGYVFIALGDMCLISSCMVILHFLRGKMGMLSTGGFFDQGSMEGCFIAITYPLLCFRPSLSKYSRPFWQNLFAAVSTFFPMIATSILCIYAGASQPIAILFSVYAVTFILRGFPALDGVIKIPMRARLVLVFLWAIIFTLIGLKMNPEFLNSNGRFGLYIKVLDWLKATPSFLIPGLGTGSFQTWGILLGKMWDPNGQYFSIFAHSDIFQILFEQGIIGLVLFIGTGVQAFRRVCLSDHWWLGVSLFAYVCTMCFNFPMHLAVHAFLGLFLLVSCLKHDDRATPYSDS